MGGANGTGANLWSSKQGLRRCQDLKHRLKKVPVDIRQVEIVAGI